MSSTNYEYRGLKAATWDLWRDDTANWSDRHFFLEIVRQFGQPVLDVGCGTGRILLDYFGAGIDIDGVDNSPEMLAICRAKATKLNLSPTMHEQRIEQLKLPRTYRTILSPSSTLQLISDLCAARQTIGGIVAHLQPGGAFVSSFHVPWRSDEPCDTGWKLLFEKTRPEDGAAVRSWTCERFEPELQLGHVEQRFEVRLNAA
jgi:SAM-dependent methyltransferase